MRYALGIVAVIAVTLAPCFPAQSHAQQQVTRLKALVGGPLIDGFAGPSTRSRCKVETTTRGASERCLAAGL